MRSGARRLNDPTILLNIVREMRGIAEFSKVACHFRSARRVSRYIIDTFLPHNKGSVLIDSVADARTHGLSAAQPIASANAGALRAIAARFRTPTISHSMWQVINTFGPFLLLWAAMMWSLDVSYW